MKNIFLLYITVSFLFSCTGGIKADKKTNKNDLGFYKLKGKVKSLRLCSYTAKDSAGQILKGNLTIDQNWKLDEKGNFIEKNTLLPLYNRVNFYIYKYDTNEHLIKDSNNQVMGTTWNIYLYDNKGYRIERDQYYSDSGVARRGIIEIYKLDDKGNKIEEDSYWGNKNSLNYKAYIKNNERGQEIEKNTLDDKGKPFMKVIRIYDDKGNQIAYERYNNLDSLESKTTFKYDEKDNEIESCTYKKDGKLDHKETNKYDDKANLIESESVTTIDSTSFHFSNLYESFDKEGNWLKSIDMKDGQPTQIVERTIEYYP